VRPRDTEPVRHLLVLVVTIAALVLVGPSAHAAPVVSAASAVTVAQADSEPSVDVGEVDQPVGGIIPRPNSGAAPRDAGDRGGPQQWFLLGTIALFFVVASASIYRTSKRAKDSNAAQRTGPVS
jgi:hypothetical protein